MQRRSSTQLAPVNGSLAYVHFVFVWDEPGAACAYCASPAAACLACPPVRAAPRAQAQQDPAANLQNEGQPATRKRLKLPPNPSSTLLQGIHLKTAFGARSTPEKHFSSHWCGVKPACESWECGGTAANRGGVLPRAGEGGLQAGPAAGESSHTPSGGATCHARPAKSCLRSTVRIYSMLPAITRYAALCSCCAPCRPHMMTGMTPRSPCRQLSCSSPLQLRARARALALARGRSAAASRQAGRRRATRRCACGSLRSGADRCLRPLHAKRQTPWQHVCGESCQHMQHQTMVLIIRRFGRRWHDRAARRARMPCTLSMLVSTAPA